MSTIAEEIKKLRIASGQVEPLVIDAETLADLVPHYQELVDYITNGGEQGLASAGFLKFNYSYTDPETPESKVDGSMTIPVGATYFPEGSDVAEFVGITGGRTDTGDNKSAMFIIFEKYASVVLTSINDITLDPDVNNITVSDIHMKLCPPIDVSEIM